MELLWEESAITQLVHTLKMADQLKLLQLIYRVGDLSPDSSITQLKSCSILNFASNV